MNEPPRWTTERFGLTANLNMVLSDFPLVVCLLIVFMCKQNTES